MDWIDELVFDERGLIPVVAQDAGTGEVLMLAYANREALEHTRSTGEAHYWSRSRGELWRKGATSGHTQQVVELLADCDGDSVLYRVRQVGPACHTGERSCFHRRAENTGFGDAPDTRPILHRIEEILEQRSVERPAGSYTTYLFEAGLDKILKKIGEEATETVIAAKNPGDAELISETADLLFHLLILLRARSVPLQAVEDELGRRFGAAPRARRPDAPPATSGG